MVAVACPPILLRAAFQRLLLLQLQRPLTKVSSPCSWCARDLLLGTGSAASAAHQHSLGASVVRGTPCSHLLQLLRVVGNCRPVHRAVQRLALQQRSGADVTRQHHLRDRQQHPAAGCTQQCADRAAPFALAHIAAAGAAACCLDRLPTAACCAVQQRGVPVASAPWC